MDTDNYGPPAPKRPVMTQSQGRWNILPGSRFRRIHVGRRRPGHCRITSIFGSHAPGRATRVCTVSLPPYISDCTKEPVF
jgi:hypothetical protein